MAFHGAVVIYAGGADRQTSDRLRILDNRRGLRRAVCGEAFGAWKDATFCVGRVISFEEHPASVAPRATVPAMNARQA